MFDFREFVNACDCTVATVRGKKTEEMLGFVNSVLYKIL